MFPLITFGNLVIANELFVVLILGPLLFMVWYYNRILKSQPVKICYEDKTGTAWIYTAFWNINHNLVSFKRSRKEKIELKKRQNPKLINFSAIKREWWFRGKEGSKETLPWSSDDIQKFSKHDAGYEGVALLKTMVDEIRYSAVQGLKANLPWILSGLGMGVGVGMVVMMLFTGG